MSQGDASEAGAVAGGVVHIVENVPERVRKFRGHVHPTIQGVHVVGKPAAGQPRQVLATIPCQVAQHAGKAFFTLVF